LASTDERKALLFVDGFQNLVDLSFHDNLGGKNHTEIRRQEHIRISQGMQSWNARGLSKATPGSFAEYIEKAHRIRQRPWFARVASSQSLQHYRLYKSQPPENNTANVKVLGEPSSHTVRLVTAGLLHSKIWWAGNSLIWFERKLLTLNFVDISLGDAVLANHFEVLLIWTHSNKVIFSCVNLAGWSFLAHDMLSSEQAAGKGR